ncbi:sporulation integral membrane protein YtvI [Bacillus sp. DNRA2]|uniref:sporulation integral membrane protein YtvI n=1 Tax=Bacillus sp. DNRA2 TaxID=2723053 RepID=UPI00145D900C|nr:sporulation integral membrane protein YtvI [Bacillus sp. DNRA2]NMD70731.1 sporulation integral membrane protein YtvI [Bacillus sp. DNRA2]
MNKTNLLRFLRLLFVLFIVLALLVGLYFLSKVTYPFIIGFIIAFMMNPLVNFLETKAKIPRALSVFITLIIIFATFAGLMTLLIAEIVSGANYIAAVVPDHLDTIIAYIQEMLAGQILPFYHQIANLFQNLDTGQQETIMNNIENVGKTFGTTVGTFIKNFFGNIPNVLSWFPNAATVLIFSLLGTFFISKDWYRLSNLIGKFLPHRAKTSGRTVFIDLKKALFGFLKAQATLISMTTIIILIGLLILRIDYAITVALITGIVDVIPYLGTGAIFVPWIIYEIITGDTGIAIGLTILYIVVLVQRQLMEPKVLSSNIGLDPLATLIALFVGFKLLGFLGLIAGPVLLVIINTLNRANVFRDVWIYIKGNEQP